MNVYGGDGSKETLLTSYNYTDGGKLSSQISHGTESWIINYVYKGEQVSEAEYYKASSPENLMKAIIAHSQESDEAIITQSDSNGIVCKIRQVNLHLFNQLRNQSVFLLQKRQQ